MFTTIGFIVVMAFAIWILCRGWVAMCNGLSFGDGRIAGVGMIIVLLGAAIVFFSLAYAPFTLTIGAGS